MSAQSTDQRQTRASSPSRRHLFLFARATITTTLIVVAGGWLTDLRQLAYLAVVAAFGIILLPFLLIVLLAALPFLLGDLCPGIAEKDLAQADSFFNRYYAFLGQRRNPALWGSVVGLVFGAMVIWGMIYALIVPPETDTVAILAQAQGRIEAHYANHGRFPSPDSAAHLTDEALNDHTADDGKTIVLDGFGRPLRYNVAGVWKLASYTLRSDGFDRSDRRDDLCVSGSTKFAKGATVAASKMLDLVDKLADGGKPGIKSALQAIQHLRCLKEH